MDETLGEARPVLAIEMADWPGQTHSARERIEHLTAHGYEPWEYFGGRLIAYQPLHRYEYTNLVFLPS